MICLLKTLCAPKKEILIFIKQYEKLVADVRQNVNTRVEYAIVPAVNVNIRMYNFDDVQCTVIPPVAYGFVTGMNLQLC